MRVRGRLLVLFTLLVMAAAGAPGAAAAQQRVVFAGDIVAQAGSTTLLKPTRLKGTRSIMVAGRAELAAGAAGSVFVTVRVTNAKGGGRLLLGPAGGSAQSVVVFPKGSMTGGTLVRVGKGDRITIRATSGAPTVSVTLTAWIPKTSAFVAPRAPVSVGATRGASGAKRFTVAGNGSVPADTTAVLLAVRTTRARRPGELKAGPAGSPAAAVAAYGRGESVSLILALPGAGGAVDIRASAGSPVVSAQVVAWAAVPSEVVAATGAKRIGRVRGIVRIKLAGRYGIPATSVRSALVAVFRQGSSTLQVVSLDAAGRGRVSSPGGSATATVVGWLANPGASAVSYLPKAETTILGPGEIVAASEDGILLDRVGHRPEGRRVRLRALARCPGSVRRPRHGGRHRGRAQPGARRHGLPGRGVRRFRRQVRRPARLWIRLPAAARSDRGSSDLVAELARTSPWKRRLVMSGRGRESGAAHRAARAFASRRRHQPRRRPVRAAGRLLGEGKPRPRGERSRTVSP